MVHIITGGCGYRHPSSFILSRPGGFSHYVLLILKSDVLFQIAGKTIASCAGHAIIIKPGTPYSYHNPYGDYVNDWLQFDKEPGIEYETRFPVMNTVIPLINTSICSDIIKQIFWENAYTPCQYAQENINCLFLVLMNHIKNSYENRENTKKPGPLYQEFCNIRLNIRNSLQEEHSINIYADKLHISSSYFQHLYSKFFGISFQKDLISARIEYAKNLLHSSNAPVSQVALVAGYHNEVHFYRQFKKSTGITPAQYKKLSI